MNKSILAEFHCHSNYSFDSLVSLEDIISTCRARGIAKIAITDHGCMEGAYKAHQMAPDLVIVSEEIQTSEGEILGYFMTEEIPDGLEPMEVIRRLQGQGAFISVAHPFDPWRGSHWKEGTLEELVPYLDGVEAFNARCFDPVLMKKRELLRPCIKKPGWLARTRIVSRKLAEPYSNSPISIPRKNCVKQ